MKLIVLLVVLMPTSIFAQRIDSYSSLFEISDSAFVRFHYDNDLFQAQDIYYTQGVCLEVVNPAFHRNPLNIILLSSTKASSAKSGMRIETAAFTPTSITSDSILYSDRPYAAIMALNFYHMNYFKNQKMKLSSDVQIGVIGPLALGKEIQTGIHKLTNNSLPRGWEHQIQNDFILNYAARLEKQIVSYASLFSLNGMGQLNLGTYQSTISIGLDFSFGRKNNLYKGVEHNFQYFIYGQSKVKAIGYDASLMGGMLNRSSAYIIPYASINKLVVEQHVGFVIQFPHIYFGVDFGWITQEFKSGQQHSWGGLRLGFY